jgi:hypothetical protein
MADSCIAFKGKDFVIMAAVSRGACVLRLCVLTLVPRTPSLDRLW